jgi:hypothetical protein
LPLFAVTLPVNATFFYSILIDTLTMKVIPTDKIMEKLKIVDSFLDS